jgi:photosystem II stability/assembly factor-like uncharacterized protein
VVPLDRRTLLAYGLRGHVHLSVDDGESWQQVSSLADGLIAAAVRLKSNYVLFAGQARLLLVSRDYGRTISASPHAPGTGVAELLEMPDGRVLALGESGATVLPAP